MIVQSAAEGQTDGRRFVMSLDQHLELVGQFATNFGNGGFASPEPRKEFMYVCRWHDRGWRDLDAAPPLDPATGLPYHLGQTPLPLMMMTSSSSPHHNEAVHPYCGLLDSMHIWGLYNGRFGYSDMVLMESITDEYRPMVEAMLDLEHRRQERLRADLAADPETAPWVEDDRLFANYKLLQLFDTLALYFQATHESLRKESTFEHVPRSLSHDADVLVRPIGDGVYEVTPYPFGQNPLEVYFEGRFMTPWTGGEEPDMAAVIRETPVERETATLVAA